MTGDNNATNMKKTEKVDLDNDNSRSTPSEAPPNLLSSITTTSTCSLSSSSSEERLAAKEKEVSYNDNDVKQTRYNM
jgi:hypothetical protein